MNANALTKSTQQAIDSPATCVALSCNFVKLPSAPTYWLCEQKELEAFYQRAYFKGRSSKPITQE